MENPAEIQVQVKRGSIIVRLQVPTQAARILWVSSVTYVSVDTTNNINEYLELVQGLQRAKASDCSPLHVIEYCAIVLSQLRTRHPPCKQHLVRLFIEASAFDN